MTKVSGKHRRTLEQIFTRPVPNTIRWDDIEKLLIHLGAKMSEGRGSRVRVHLHGEVAVFHRPHPKPVTDKGAVTSVKQFLENAGIRP